MPPSRSRCSGRRFFTASSTRGPKRRKWKKPRPPAEYFPTGQRFFALAPPLQYDCAANRRRRHSLTERWPSGRRRTPAKGVRVKSPSRVRIPLSPPFFSSCYQGLEFSLQSVLADLLPDLRLPATASGTA